MRSAGLHDILTLQMLTSRGKGGNAGASGGSSARDWNQTSKVSMRFNLYRGVLTEVSAGDGLRVSAGSAGSDGLRKNSLYGSQVPARVPLTTLLCANLNLQPAGMLWVAMSCMCGKCPSTGRTPQ